MRSFITSAPRPVKRNIKKVPFVELFDGRLQGVVSSGSDIKRVYVSFIAAGSGEFFCSTNNNRPCGGLRGAPCKHLDELAKEAVIQFGADAVIGYLGANIEGAETVSAYDLTSALGGTQVKADANVVFSRFLNYLRYCELQTRRGHVSEMAWF